MIDIEPSILRILKNKDQIVGTGFLVSKTLAVTCAHVAIAAGLDGENRIRVQFSGQKQTIYATVLDEFLNPDRDIAILRLETMPEDSQPLRLGLAEHSRPGNNFRSFGYATAAEMQGIFANGSIDGYLRQHKLIQLQSVQANHGISGAPVWDEQRGVVIGMITKGHTELGRNENTTFATPAELLFEICPEIQPDETCPYLGLESFSAETERFFFGRTALTEKLLTTLSRGCRFLAVFGPSGSGKSSVVRAGLLPALAKGQLPGSQKWAQVTIRPAGDPFAQMKALSLGLRDIEGYLRRHPGMERIILFVDQFEELFTLCPDELRDGFVRDLAAALDASHLVLVICMRDDFYSAFNAKATPLAASADKVVVDVSVTLERDDLAAMIEQPAAAVGLALEEGLTDVIIKDAATDGVARSSTLPLLEFALTQLWDKRRDGLLTHDAYQSIGGVTGSLARWADDAYSDLSKTEQPLAESLLTALIHLGDERQGLPDTRRRALNEFDAPTQRVIKHFADRRLLVTSGETLELVHDALVREWSRLQGWIKSNRDNLRLREGVSNAASQWEMSGENENLLNHRGGRLDDALLLINNSRYGLSILEQAYLKACTALRKKEQREREQRLRLTVAAAIIAMIIFFALGSFGLLKSNESTAQAGTAQANALDAKRQASISHANEIAAQAIVNRDKNFQISLLLGVEAFNISDTVQARGVLMDNLRANPQLQTYFIGHKDVINSVAFSKDGKMLASGSNDGAILLWDVNAHKLIGQPLIGNSREVVTTVAFSMDGKILASGTSDAKVILWDVATGKMIGQPFSEHLGPITSLTFSPDGKTLASASTDKTFIIWNINTHQKLIGPIIVDPNKNFGVKNIAFSPDGKTLAIGVFTDIILWDVNAQQVIGQPLNGYLSEVNCLAFNVDGKILVSGRGDGTIVLWDVAKQKSIFQSIIVGASINAIAFSPDGKTLVSGSDDGTIFLHDMNLESSFGGRSLGKNPGQVSTIAFRADGKTFATNSDGNNIVLWHIEAHQRISRLVGLPDDAFFSYFRFSPDGTTLAAGTLDGKVFLWDLATDRLISQQTIENSNGISNIVFNHDSDILTLYNFTGTALGWDLKTNQMLGSPLKDHDILGISHDGKTLVLRNYVGEQSQFVFWDVTKGRLFGQPINGFTGIDAFSDDDRTLILQNAGSMAFWDMEKQLLIGQPLIGSFLNFLRDGKTLLYLNDDGYNLWDMEKQQPIGKTIPLVKAAYFRTNPVMSPDEKTLAAGVDYGRITLLNLETGQPIGQSMNMESGAALQLVFSPNSKLLASGGGNSSIILWDLATHQPIGQPISGYHLQHHTLAFSPNDKSFAFINTESKIILWDLDPKSWVQKTCEIVGRNFTLDEWVLYFPNDAYRVTCPQWPAQPEIIITPAPAG